MLAEKLINLSLNKPKTIYGLILLVVVAAGLAMFNIKVDTDPENMLSADEPARVFHNQTKAVFSLSDIIVVGAVSDSKQGIYNKASLSDLKTLTDYVLTMDGVVKADVNSLSTIDNIEQINKGTIRFEWMMKEQPKDDASAQAIKTKAKRLPFVLDTMVSGDDKAATIYVPIKDKNESFKIAKLIKSKIAELSDANQYYITGLPVAEDTFGVEMFIQMAISAPAAALVIYLLMLWFFKNPVLVSAPMILAMATVIITMGTMIGMGYTVHIMSSMIPIFLMPIAVVDSVHMMSEFADRYVPGKHSGDVIKKVTKQLFKPMLFTSITSAAGFFSLAVTPIPPVQIFGMFVGSGILLAFILTIIFIPAYVSRMSVEKLHAMRARLHNSHGDEGSWLARKLPMLGAISERYAKFLIVIFIGIGIFSWYGIQRIQVNDNPVRWFKSNHEIRVADRVLNSHFAGTYDAHLVFKSDNASTILADWKKAIAQLSDNSILPPETKYKINQQLENAQTIQDVSSFASALDDLAFELDDKQADALGVLIDESDRAITKSKTFTQPKVLHWIEGLQNHLNSTGFVGKSNSVADLIKTVNRELNSGTDKDYLLPNSQAGVAQSLLQFQSSHRPQDLWHFVTTDYQHSLVWLQLTSGDNKDMSAVVQSVDEYTKANRLPEGVRYDWAGKAYLNLVWQDKMVTGMFESLSSSFVVVFIMMVVLFRSLIFGLLAMLPLTITIGFMYGMIGWIGKFYDMPIAVLSALTLGLSVDFAIHFIQRTREEYEKLGSWDATIKAMFEEPARAISRNALVIALGFTPLLLAPLVPYITVGAFLAAIMAVSSIVTIVLLPASMTLIRRWIF